MARPNNFDIQTVIDAINGTCMNTVESMTEELYPEMSENDLTQEDYTEVDQQIFLCACCGWWCDQSEANESEEYDQDICDDCNEEDEDEQE